MVPGDIAVTVSSRIVVEYLHSKGPQDMDESDCIGSKYLVVVCTTRTERQPFSAHVQWQLAWSGEIMKLVGASSLQAIVLYWSTNYTLQFGYELIQWVPQLLETGFQFLPAGKAFFCAYGGAEFEWELAWSNTILPSFVHHGMLFYHTLECYVLTCYLENQIEGSTGCFFYGLHSHWDPGGLTQLWIGIKFKFRKIAWLLVLSSYAGSEIYSGIVTITFWLPPFHYREMSFWRYSSVGQMTLNKGHAIQCGLDLNQWKNA
jgi:hypothetical protein